MPCSAEDAPDETITAYLTGWQSGEYSKMYDMLSSRSRILTSRWEFIESHEKMEARFTIIDFSVYDEDFNGDRAVVWYWITTKKPFGEQRTDNKITHLLKESGLWRIDTEKSCKDSMSWGNEYR